MIEPFDIAPNVAAEVPSGKIVAAGLLDVLTRIQAASRASIEHRKLSNAWTNEISIEVPETGISIGQLERTIKTRFGHDQHIDGDLAKTQVPSYTNLLAKRTHLSSATIHQNLRSSSSSSTAHWSIWTSRLTGHSLLSRTGSVLLS